MRNDCELLEEAYDNVADLEDLDSLLSETALESMQDLLGKVKNIDTDLPAFLGGLGSYFKQATMIGLGAGLAAQLIGWIFIGASKMIKKDLAAEMRIRKQVADDLFTRKREKIDPDSLTSDELYDAYKNIESELAETLDEKYPIKGKTKWALVLNKVGMVLKNKVGTSIMALAGLATFFRMTNAPVYGAEPTFDNWTPPDTPTGAGRDYIGGPSSFA